MTIPKAAAVQMVSGPDRERNLAAAGELIGHAADAGAQLIVLPENFGFLGHREPDKLAIMEEDGSGPIQDFLAEQAARHRVWLVGGSVALRGQTETERAFAACLVYNETGARAARFDKIHLFDISMPDSDESYRESDCTIAGSQPVVLDTPVGRLGLSVCYDLRFPELYRQLSRQGAELLTVPSAFTAATGRAHWEVLVRARAIENLSFVIAPNQGGRHAGGRETYGDSMLVNPWGHILDRVASGPGIAVGEIDLTQLRHTRSRFPSLEHRVL